VNDGIHDGWRTHDEGGRIPGDGETLVDKNGVPCNLFPDEMRVHMEMGMTDLVVRTDSTRRIVDQIDCGTHNEDRNLTLEDSENNGVTHNEDGKILNDRILGADGGPLSMKALVGSAPDTILI
jgi:hypothetical protein